jgi:FdhD protein
MKHPPRPKPLWRYRPNQWETATTDLTVEAPVSLTVNGEVWLAFLCTPVDLEALAVGFLFNEGLIAGAEEVAAARACPHGTNVDVWLRRDVPRPRMWRRTSGCAGGATAEPNTGDGSPPVARPCAGPRLTPAVICAQMGALLAAQDLYRTAGGVHASALSDGERLLYVAEDIGRHNTLDKLAGRCLLDRRATRGLLALTTGRVSSEMAQKAARMGAPFIISRSAPSSLAVEIAEQAGLTLIGYARRDQFNVYTHAERVRVDAHAECVGIEAHPGPAPLPAGVSIDVVSDACQA